MSLSPSPISNWSSIPADVLLQIVDPYTLTASEARFTSGNPQLFRNAVDPRKRDHANPHFLSQLRLVCRHWYLVLTPPLYQRTIVRVHPPDTRYQEAFKCHPDLIQHLIVDIAPPFQWKHLAFQPDLLQACLAECSNIQTLELVGIDGPCYKLTRGKAYTLFQSIRSPVTHLRILRTSTGVSRGLSSVLIGLGRLCDRLTTLEIYGGLYVTYLWGDGTGGQGHHRYNRWPLPRSLPNISRLALSCLGFFDWSYEDIISRIHRRVRNADGSKTIVSPLRELILDGQIGLLHNDWVARALQVNNIAATLTVFELSIPWDTSAQENRYPHFEELPLEVIAKCRSLVSFRYYAHFTTKIFSRLSNTTSELGIRIVPPYPPGMPPNTPLWFPDTIITNVQPIIEFVQSAKMRNGVSSVVIGWKEPDEDEWCRLKEVCAKEGVSVKMLP